MKELRRVLTEITRLTNTIETDYPEIYPFLDENPMTIPSDAHPNLNSTNLREYLEDLEQLLKHHLDSHRRKRHEDF
ncbi:MAG: hypothetical protein HKN31_11840 [Pricia sp.]|nr:hypothetical protein [Pricia sp.]